MVPHVEIVTMRSVSRRDERGNAVNKKSASKRHSKKEIAEKLARAEQMARDGKTQSEIATVLGVSVMTYHRWRKEFRANARPAPDSSNASRIREVEAENARLRDFVVRMLLKNESLKERA